MVLQAFVVEFVVVEDFDHYCQHAGEFVGVKAHLKHLVIVLTVL